MRGVPPRGVPNHKLKFLIGALGSNALDVPSAMNMFMGFQEQQQAKRAAALEAVSGSNAGLDALRDATMQMVTDDDYQSPSDFASRLTGLASTYGMSGIPENVATGLETLYQSQPIVFDDKDRETIAGSALMFKSRPGASRKEFRDAVHQQYIARLGPNFERIRGEVNDWIDAAWDGMIPPSYITG